MEESRIPRAGFQAQPISESQLINLLSGTPLEGSLFTVKRILDFAGPLTWQSQICRAERHEGWEGTPGVRLGLGVPQAFGSRGRPNEGSRPGHSGGGGRCGGV